MPEHPRAGGQRPRTVRHDSEAGDNQAGKRRRGDDPQRSRVGARGRPAARRPGPDVDLRFHRALAVSPEGNEWEARAGASAAGVAAPAWEGDGETTNATLGRGVAAVAGSPPPGRERLTGLGACAGPEEPGWPGMVAAVPGCWTMKSSTAGVTLGPGTRWLPPAMNAAAGTPSPNRITATTAMPRTCQRTTWPPSGSWWLPSGHASLRLGSPGSAASAIRRSVR